MSFITDHYFRTQRPSGELIEKLILFDEQEFPFKWSQKFWSDFIETRDYHLFVRHNKNGQELIAMALFEVINDGEVVHLHKIAVSSQVRAQGHGHALMKHCVAVLEQVGISGIYLEVATDNAVAISLYEKMGLEVRRHVKSFYSNGDDAYIMYNY